MAIQSYAFPALGIVQYDSDSDILSDAVVHGWWKPESLFKLLRERGLVAELRSSQISWKKKLDT